MGLSPQPPSALELQRLLVQAAAGNRVGVGGEPVLAPGAVSGPDVEHLLSLNPSQQAPADLATIGDITQNGENRLPANPSAPPPDVPVPFGETRGGQVAGLAGVGLVSSGVQTGGVSGGIQGALGGAATGAAIGSVIPGIGTAIGAVIGGGLGLVAGGFGGGGGGGGLSGLQKLQLKNRARSNKFFRRLTADLFLTGAEGQVGRTGERAIRQRRGPGENPV